MLSYRTTYLAGNVNGLVTHDEILSTLKLSGFINISQVTLAMIGQFTASQGYIEIHTCSWCDVLL